MACASRRPRSIWLTSHEELEARLCLSTVSFATHEITSEAGAHVIYAVDIDNDGDVDVLTRSDKRTAWYENTNGKGAFGEEQVIDSDDGGSVLAVDIDGDGDVDVLSGLFSGNRVGWYEKHRRKGSVWRRTGYRLRKGCSAACGRC